MGLCPGLTFWVMCACMRRQACGSSGRSSASSRARRRWASCWASCCPACPTATPPPPSRRSPRVRRPFHGTLGEADGLCPRPSLPSWRQGPATWQSLVSQFGHPAGRYAVQRVQQRRRRLRVGARLGCAGPAPPFHGTLWEAAGLRPRPCLPLWRQGLAIFGASKYFFL